MNELVKEAREFLATPNLGKSLMRELDKAMIYIRRLADAHEAAEARADIAERELENVGKMYNRACGDILEYSERINELEAALEEDRLEENAFLNMRDRAESAEAKIARLETDKGVVLNRLDEMNGAGDIRYEEYRELNDLVQLIGTKVESEGTDA